MHKKCEHCGKERSEDIWLVEFEGEILCNWCLKAVGWIRGVSRGPDIPNHPCPRCGAPMADYSTPDELFFHCEDCNVVFKDPNKGINIFD